jgi:hypothetical protein
MAEISLGLHVGPGNSFRMNADRPFLLAKVDDHTGRQLFLGVIGDPAANPAAPIEPRLAGLANGRRQWLGQLVRFGNSAR